MLKLIATFFLSIVAVTAQGNEACNATATPQIILDALAALNTERASNGVAPSDKGAVKLFAELSAMAATKLADISATCVTAPKYGFVTGGTCCPSDSTTNLHMCVRGPTESAKFGGIAADVDALIGIEVLGDALTNANAATEIPKVIATGKAAHFLLNNGTDVLNGVGIATMGTDIVFIATKHAEADYTECGTPATTPAPGPTAGGTTTQGTGMANSTTTRPSGASHVGVGIATLSAVAMCVA